MKKKPARKKPAQPAPAAPVVSLAPKQFWAVFRCFHWDSIEVTAFGQKYPMSKQDIAGTVGFIPIFDSYEKALDWNGGSTASIVKLETA